MADFVWKECCTPTMRAAEAIEQCNRVIVNPITFKTKKKGKQRDYSQTSLVQDSGKLPT